MATGHSFQGELKHLQHVFATMQPQMEITLRDVNVALEGHVVVFNTGISHGGPLPNCAKGGTRIRAGLTLEEVRMLARTMAIKNAAAGLPLGGCKSGLQADPKQENFKTTYCRFVELCKPFLYENGGPFGGFGFDIGAHPDHALWACETLGTTRSFTGKPLHLGGTDYDREGIAGFGVAEAAKQLLLLHRHNLLQKSFVIHGLGAMGAAVLKNFSQTGAQLAGFGDPCYGGTWCFEKPISEDLLQALYQRHTHTALALLEREGKKISADANTALFVKSDVLFPCAMQYAIDVRNAEQVNADYIVEGANNPVALEAYPLLHHRGIHIIPDFIANAGGIIAAFVEMTSTVNNEENVQTRAKVKQAFDTTRSTIHNNLQHIAALTETHACSLRDAGLYRALTTIIAKELRI